MKKKKNEKKGAGTEWASAHFNMGTVSQYKHCIVTWWFWSAVLARGKCIAIEDCIVTWVCSGLELYCNRKSLAGQVVSQYT